MSLYKLKKLEAPPKEIIEQLRKWATSLKNIDGVLGAFVFGSFAEGNAHVESDLDIAVIIESSVDKRSIPRPLKGTFPVDFVILRGTEFQSRRNVGGIAMVIDQQGIEIYPKWSWKV